MRLARIIGLATLGYGAYKAYQSYSRSGRVQGPDTGLTGSTTTSRRSMIPLRRRGAL